MENDFVTVNAFVFNFAVISSSRLSKIIVDTPNTRAYHELVASSNPSGSIQTTGECLQSVAVRLLASKPFCRMPKTGLKPHSVVWRNLFKFG